MNLYDISLPNQQQLFREVTERCKVMAGVTSPTFRCKCCGEIKCIAGRKMITPGRSADGYKCKGCVTKADVLV